MASTKALHKEQCVSVIVIVRELIRDQWGLVINYEIHMASLYLTHTDMLICALFTRCFPAEWLLMCCVCLTQVNREEEGGMKEGYKGRLASVSSSQSNASSGFSEEKGEISEEDSGELMHDVI